MIQTSLPILPDNRPAQKAYVTNWARTTLNWLIPYCKDIDRRHAFQNEQRKEERMQRFYLNKRQARKWSK